MFSIQDSLSVIQARIQQAELAANRREGSVRLIAVSKMQPVSSIIQAYQLGQRHFGESYVQEALRKQFALSAFDIVWHFIGPIQSNKTKVIAQHFAWVHSVDRVKTAERLSAQRPANLSPLQVCLQVNISGESSKSGIMSHELPALVAAVEGLPGLCLRGVMAVPEPEPDVLKQRLPFKRLYDAVQQLHHPAMDTFSMGMSDDLEAAIAEGATLVRVGSALFGTRHSS